jgi:hypothetical protein
MLRLPLRILASFIVAFSLAGCDPATMGTSPEGWSEADKAKAATRERRSEFYRGGRYGMR